MARDFLRPCPGRPCKPDIFAATYEPVEAAPGDSSTHEGGV